MPLACLFVLMSWMVFSILFDFIGVINTEERPCECCHFSEGDEKGFVDLPHRGDIDSAEEHYKPS